MNPVKTGALIREQRIENHLTEQELAEKAGISMELLESYEQGTALFRASVLKRLTGPLGLSLMELMYGKRLTAVRSSHLHTIRMDLIRTAYDYKEYYWIIDGKAIVTYLDEWVRAGGCPDLEPFGSLTGLLPAWTGELVWKADNRFIWEMIDSPETLNVPILVCEDDCDLSCIVILVRIRKTENLVIWEKLGRLTHENEDFNLEKRSGILCLEAYTDEDWEQYGDNIACEPCDSAEYRQWISSHWDEELIRRRRNYTKPYMQNEAHIQWIAEPGWCFERAAYDRMVEAFRDVYKAGGKR